MSECQFCSEPTNEGVDCCASCEDELFSHCCATCSNMCSGEHEDESGEAICDECYASS